MKMKMKKYIIPLLYFISLNVLFGADMNLDYTESFGKGPASHIYKITSNEAMSLRYIIKCNGKDNKVTEIIYDSHQSSKEFEINFRVFNTNKNFVENISMHQKNLWWHLKYNDWVITNKQTVYDMGYSNFSANSVLVHLKKNQKNISNDLILYKETSSIDKRFFEVSIKLSKDKQ